MDRENEQKRRKYHRRYPEISSVVPGNDRLGIPENFHDCRPRDRRISRSFLRLPTGLSVLIRKCGFTCFKLHIKVNNAKVHVREPNFGEFYSFLFFFFEESLFLAYWQKLTFPRKVEILILNVIYARPTIINFVVLDFIWKNFLRPREVSF